MKCLKNVISLVILLTIILSIGLPFRISAADPLMTAENASEIGTNLAPYTNDPMPVIVTMIVISAVGIVVLLAVTAVMKRRGK